MASIPCSRLQEGILTGVLNTELDDVVTELLFIFFISVHHSAGRRLMTPVDEQQLKDQTFSAH